MKKQAFSNGSLKEAPEALPKDDFIKRLEETTSVVDFYRKKQEIISRLRRAQGE